MTQESFVELGKRKKIWPVAWLRLRISLCSVFDL